MVCSLWIDERLVSQHAQRCDSKCGSNQSRGARHRANARPTHCSTPAALISSTTAALIIFGTPTPLAGSYLLMQSFLRRCEMIDKDRIEGSAEQAKGKVKEWTGKVLGDKKTENEGKADQIKGKVQNAVGGLKDTLRGK
jgi:uncharacterized protein YjbJ (UPF0337 family)